MGSFNSGGWKGLSFQGGSVSTWGECGASELQFHHSALALGEAFPDPQRPFCFPSLEFIKLACAYHSVELDSYFRGKKH